MRGDVLERAAELARRGEPFALATVVRREPPSSARVGDVAIVTPDGAFHGWVGGTCTRPTVIREARAALADGQPRLIALTPDGEAASRPGVKALPMTCHSGGSVDVYIDPVTPAPVLYVFGATPAARALADLGAGSGYAVTAVDPEAVAGDVPRAERVVGEIDPDDEPPAGAAGRYAIVATQGQWDEAAIRIALALEPAWLGVLASRRRFEEMRGVLLDRGVDAAALDAVEAPAGLDVGAVTPAEIALSVLARLVEVRRRGAGSGSDAVGAVGSSDGDRAAAPGTARAAPGRPAGTAAAPGPDAPAVDPVCGMTVEPGPGVPAAEHEGETYLFCCGGCRERFLADPDAYVAAAPGAAG